MKPVDDAPVWSIVCFVVPPEFRHRGVAAALLRGAIEYAAKRGARVLEAYPIDKAERGRDDWMWHGAVPGARWCDSNSRRRADLTSSLSQVPLLSAATPCPSPTSSPPSAPRAVAVTAGCPAGTPSTSPRRC